MTRLILVRHPQTIEGCQHIIAPWEGGRLSLRGVQQANATARALAAQKPSKIISSDSERCRYLAQQLSANTGVPVMFTESLRERNPGCLAGCEKSHLDRLAYDRRPPEGENIEDVMQRAHAVQKMLPKEDLTCIISHATFLKCLTASYLDVPAWRALTSLKFSNCGISTLQSANDGTYTLACHNDRHHLDNIVTRIHCFGSYASGKTSLSTALAARFQIPRTSLDSLKYERQFDIVRSPEERIALLEDITSKDAWITEGSWGSYAASAFERADLLLLLDPGYARSVMWASRRQLSRVGLPSAPNDGVGHYLKLLYEITQYYHSNDREKEHTGFLQQFNTKVRIIRTRADFRRAYKASSPDELWRLPQWTYC